MHGTLKGLKFAHFSSEIHVMHEQLCMMEEVAKKNNTQN